MVNAPPGAEVLEEMGGEDAGTIRGEQFSDAERGEVVPHDIDQLLGGVLLQAEDGQPV